MVIGQFTTFPVDGVMSIIVALLVLKTGFDVVRDQMDTLMGAKTNPELGRQIIAMLNQYDEILGTHDLMIHDYGPGRCVASIHAEVPADANLVAIHEVIDRAESDISRALHIPICIHIDPIVVGDPIFDSITAHFNHILSQQYPGTHIHDLRMVPGEKLLVDVFAAEVTEVLFLNVGKMLSQCPNSCGHHTQLIRNLLAISAQKNLQLSRRIFNTSSKSIRGRLLSYLSDQAVKNESERFDIPFNRQQLADYLGVDRSALSAELGKMQREGLLEFRKNHFHLYEEVRSL